MPDYVVKPGDCVENIAFAHGHFPKTVWQHQNNAALRDKRGGDGVALAPGDVVFVPDRRDKSVDAPTGALHTFRRKGVPSKLRLQMLSSKGEPRANLNYRIELAGQPTYSGTTDGEGRVDAFVPPDAQSGTLVITPEEGDEDEVYELRLGHLDPLDMTTGVQGRLRNLGCYDGPIHGELDGPTQEAIQAFQASQTLVPSGELDEETLRALAKAHDG